MYKFIWCGAIIAIQFVAGLVFAAEIEGVIIDRKTHEPVIGAAIKIAESGKGAKSRLDGSFKIHGVGDGPATIKVTRLGYVEFDTVVQARSGDYDITLNIELSPTVVHGREVDINAHAEHGSDIEAQKTERNSDNVISAVSARTIEVSPDLSVANVSQRLSGVTVTRSSSNGDGQYAIIRGMEKRYNYTTVNGVKIPSPDNKNRYVPLDIFPSELLDRLEVTKSLLPTMEGDAIGGAMNLVMKQAPDHFIATGKVGTGYNGLFFDRKFYTVDLVKNETSPRLVHPGAVTVADFPLANFNPKAISASPNAYLSATLGDRFFEDQSLGLIVSGTYQHTYRGSNSLFYPTTASQQTSLPEITDLDNRIYSTLQTRSGVMANLDYRANETNTFQLFGMYADLNSLEVRDEYDSILGLSWPKTIRIPWARRVTNEDQAISNVTLSGIHQIFGKDLEADWKLVYSRAALDRPDRAELDLYGGVDLDSAGVYHPQQYLVNGGSPRTWITSTDQDKSVYLNLKTTENILDTKTEFTYGGMYRNKERHATYDKYDLRPNNKFRVQNYNGDITLDTFTVFNPQGSPDDPLNYDAHENITAGFLQAKFQVGQIQAIGGVRVENTDFGWNSQAPEVFDGKSGTITYMDILPSVSLKYMPTDNQNWRLSFFRSISRPGFFEVIPNLGVPGEDYTETTNDTLNRTQATNIDLRWEYFPGGLDQILVGAFYKNLHDPIEYSVVEVLTKTFYEPRNWGDATNYGFEVDLRKYFSEFGIHANYTFTSSNITTDKRVNYRSTDPKIGLTYRVESQTRPLQGQSAHIANLSLLYKNFETGTDCQLGLVYTGANIVGVSPYKDNDVWQRPIIQVDLSGEQKLIGNLALYLKINNLLNSPREEEIRQSYTQGIAPILNQTAGSNFLVRRETYDRTYIIGLKFRM